MATNYIKSYNNLDYEIETNGEIHILDCLTRVDIRTVFDVGANEGVYTRACISRFKNAEIHAFEIAPATYEKLARNLALARGKLNNFGLSALKTVGKLLYHSSRPELTRQGILLP